MKNSHSLRRQVSSWPWIATAFFVLIVLFAFLAEHEHRRPASSKHDVANQPAGAGGLENRTTVDALKRNRARNAQDPLSRFEYIFDQSRDGQHHLGSTGSDKKFIPETDVASGSDLWLHDANGKDRLISESVYRAKFSPDGTKIAYTTSDAVLHVEDLAGGELLKIKGAYDPDWKSDSSSVAFAKVPEGLPDHMPGALKVAIAEVNSGKIKELTDGTFDDVRPHFSADDNSVLFVSGGRSGLASFWKVPVNGGKPEQVTNLGLQEVNEKFVPTPYSRSGWSPDKHWFVYDFKSGPREETWGLEFDRSGKFKQAKRIGDGVDPRWQDGKTFTATKHDGDQVQLVQYTLP